MEPSPYFLLYSVISIWLYMNELYFYLIDFILSNLRFGTLNFGQERYLNYDFKLYDVKRF